jgi:Flp pilus assembly pilin Flp
MYSERYMLPFQAPFLLLAAWGVRRLSFVRVSFGRARTGTRPYTPTTVGAAPRGRPPSERLVDVARYGLVLLLVAVLLVGVVAQVRTLDKPDWRGLAAELTGQAQPGDLVLFVPGWHAKPFDYYAQGKLDIYADVPVPVPQHAQEALQAVAQAIQGHARVWLVWETGHYTDPNGQVLAYLEAQLRKVYERPGQPEAGAPGRVILFEREDE